MRLCISYAYWHALALLIATLVTCVIAGASLAANTQVDHALLNENFTRFDQRLDSGWRTVMVQMHYLDAAELIEQYQFQHSKTLLKWQKASLAYHLGVVYSLANERREAIYWFHQALAPKLLGNPAYVNAHIAFEANDREGLLQARDKIAQYKPNTMQTEDLKETDAMIEYFGEPFEAAFGALNCIEHARPNSSMWQDFCKTMAQQYSALYQTHQKSE